MVKQDQKGIGEKREIYTWTQPLWIHVCLTTHTGPQHTRGDKFGRVPTSKREYEVHQNLQRGWIVDNISQ